MIESIAYFATVTALAIGLAACLASRLLGFILGRKTGAFHSGLSDNPDHIVSSKHGADQGTATGQQGEAKGEWASSLGQYQQRQLRTHERSLSPHQRRELFANLPHLNELREEALEIRGSTRIWDDHDLCRQLRATDPLAAQVLAKYERSVDRLG